MDWYISINASVLIHDTPVHINVSKRKKKKRKGQWRKEEGGRKEEEKEEEGEDVVEEKEEEEEKRKCTHRRCTSDNMRRDVLAFCLKGRKARCACVLFKG